MGVHPMQVTPTLLGMFRNEHTQEIRRLLPRFFHSNPLQRPSLSDFRTLLKEEYFDPREPHIKMVSSLGHTDYIRQDTLFNKEWIHAFIPEEARYWIEDWQFFVRKKRQTWILVINPNNVNTVMYNGYPAQNMTRLKGGDTLYLQSKHSDRETARWTLSIHP